MSEPMTETADRCVRCDHPRGEGPLLIGRMLYGLFSFPFVDHRTHCALCYEQLGWRAHRIVALGVGVAAIGVGLGAEKPLIVQLGLITLPLAWIITRPFATSVAERIAEREARRHDRPPDPAQSPPPASPRPAVVNVLTDPLTFAPAALLTDDPAPEPRAPQPRCAHCTHPREPVLMADYFWLTRFAPHVDRHTYCALHYEERCISHARILVGVFALILGAQGLASGNPFAPLVCGLIWLLIWYVGGIFLRSVRERIEERGPARPPGDDPS